MIFLGGEEGPEHIAVGRDGKLYAAVASGNILRMHQDGSTRGVFAYKGGRVLEYAPAISSTRIVAKGLSFANFVAQSADGKNLFVARTGRYRVWQIAVDASNLDLAQAHPKARVLLDNLPGYPDNLMRGLDGKLWLGLAKPRNPVVDNMADQPFMRKLTLRLPRALWPLSTSYGHVMAFTEDGKIVADLQDPSGPIRKPQRSPKQRIGSTSRACMPKAWAGCRNRPPLRWGAVGKTAQRRADTTMPPTISKKATAW